MTRFDPAAAQVFIQGVYRQRPGDRRRIVDPADLSEVGCILESPPAVIDEAIAAANAAQAGWRRLDAKTRARLLHQVASSIEAGDFHDVAVLMVREMGKPYPEATGELANAAPVFRYFAEMARDEAGKVAGTTEAGSFQYARYEPYGVSVHIMPFNFPVLLMCWTLAASLAAGNACVVKPAEATSLCTLKFMEHFRALPAGLVNCVTGGADVARHLIAAPDTHAIAFTGSLKAGREVAKLAAERLKPAIIEAGGNDAMIVSAHAPIEVAAAGAVTAAFHLSGQVCTSTERLFVHDAVHDAFVERFVAGARALRVGPGLGAAEIGPLVSEAARARAMSLVEAAVAEGASIACGGRVPPGFNTGWFYEPTILTGVRPDSVLMREEVFAPVAAVCRVSTFEEAIALANASDFGLGACVFTTDLAEAQMAAEELQAGMVWINNPLIDNDALPFGGWKLSGLGRELGRQGLDAFRRSKMVVVDASPQIKDWWYPYPDDWFYKGAGRKF